jgi:hypothetical protein
MPATRSERCRLAALETCAGISMPSEDASSSACRECAHRCDQATHAQNRRHRPAAEGARSGYSTTFRDGTRGACHRCRGTVRGTSAGRIRVHCVRSGQILETLVQVERAVRPSNPRLTRGFGADGVGDGDSRSAGRRQPPARNRSDHRQDQGHDGQPDASPQLGSGLPADGRALAPSVAPLTG